MKTTLHPLLALILIFLITILASSCAKDSSSTTGTPSNYTLLTEGGGAWTVQTIQYQQSNGTWTNQSGSAGEFSVTFSGNYNYSTLESNDFTNNNVWTLTGETLGCNGSTSALFGTFTITQLTTTSLDLTAVNYQNMPGFSYTGERLTFSKN